MFRRIYVFLATLLLRLYGLAIITMCVGGTVSVLKYLLFKAGFLGMVIITFYIIIYLSKDEDTKKERIFLRNCLISFIEAFNIDNYNDKDIK